MCLSLLPSHILASNYTFTPKLASTITEQNNQPVTCKMQKCESRMPHYQIFGDSWGINIVKHFVAKFVDTKFMLFPILFTGTIFDTTAFCGAVAMVKGPFGGNSSKTLFRYKAL